MEKIISVRLTDAQDKALEAYAKSNGVSKNTAVKLLILGADFFGYIVKYFELDHLEEITQAVKPLMLQELQKQIKSRRAKDPEQDPTDPAEP